MKICFTCPEFSLNCGIGKVSVNLVDKLSKNHEVTLVTNKYENKIEGIKAVEYDVIKKPGFMNILSIAERGTKIVQRLDAKEDFDIIHTQGEILRQDVMTSESCHGAWINDIRKEKGMLYNILSRVHPQTIVTSNLEKKRYKEKLYKKTIAISHQVKNDIIRTYGVPVDDIITIWHGVDYGYFKISESKKEEIREKIRSAHNIGDEKVLLFVGQAFYKKGLAEIIMALPGVEAKLIVVGNDKQKPFIKMAESFGVREKIIFTGHVPEIREYYHASDIFVFPTRHEPFGLVITEAMACGVPVITSKEAGASELMSDGKDALILNNPRNYESLKEKINMLLNDESLMKKLQSNGLKIAKKTDWKFVAREYDKVYKMISNS